VSEPVSLQIRTWNIAHGRDVPPDRGHRHLRRKLLDQMAALIVEQSPDIILLQEVPVWAGSLLREATGMGVTLAPAYGAHLPDLVRTQIEGQANAVLYGPDLLLVSARRVQLNAHHRLRGEPRIAQLVRLRHRSAGRELALANVHADWGDNRHQLERAGFVLERFARGAPMVLGGDLNAGPKSASLRALAARGWNGESVDPGIDRILVQGLRMERPAVRWPPERRDLVLNGGPPVRLSDHDPVDAVVLL
jgi:endonuclease/exonuclease/phosphatase family metal-dependent hydrolase